ncbi:hypothetical protein [Halosolutus gelatinilyticus]|uniref:hypothetical protein n=1 Tax=Halosolutus gelatinilyticus TaxID=2931975 RepID=UPI001FF43027|nr:hypothetical protein [Halosolutus gelatinilyticus]
MTGNKTTKPGGRIGQGISQRLAWIALVTITTSLLLETRIEGGLLETLAVVIVAVGLVMLVAGIAVRFLELRED